MFTRAGRFLVTTSAALLVGLISHISGCNTHSNPFRASSSPKSCGRRHTKSCSYTKFIF